MKDIPNEMVHSKEIQSEEYNRWLESIKRKIKSAQLKAAVSVNAQLIELNWDLGKEIVDKQRNQTGEIAS